MSKEVEEWRDIEGYEGLYQVSDWGRVRNRFGRIIKQEPCKRGYCRLKLCKNGTKPHKFVHLIVAKAFIPNPNGCDTVHHKDHNPQNNMKDNLEWMTKDEHYKLHQAEQGYQVDMIDKQSGEVLDSFVSLKEAARIVGGHDSNIVTCCNGGRFVKGKWKKINSMYGFIWKYKKE